MGSCVTLLRLTSLLIVVAERLLDQLHHGSQLLLDAAGKREHVVKIEKALKAVRV